MAIEQSRINVKNKKASFEFELLEKYIAGMQLRGTEIKSIRDSKASIAEAYCFFRNEELYIKNMNISEYAQGSYNNHEPKRDRKLLLQKQELKKLFNHKKKDKSLTIVPLRLFINERGFAKIEIALAKGKKLYDKREDIKRKDIERETDRRLK